MHKLEAIKLVTAAAEHGAEIAKHETEHGEVARIGRYEVSDIERAIELVKRFEMAEEPGMKPYVRRRDG